MEYTVEKILEGQGYKLRRTGNIIRTQCPFHKDPVPSFTIYPDTDSFYCFGCHVGGGAKQLLRLFKIPIPKELYDVSEDPIQNATDDDEVKAFLNGQLGMSGQKTVSIYKKIIRVRQLRGRGHDRWLNRITVALIEGGSDA
jgi:hypothetical protein